MKQSQVIKIVCNTIYFFINTIKICKKKYFNAKTKTSHYLTYVKKFRKQSKNTGTILILEIDNTAQCTTAIMKVYIQNNISFVINSNLRFAAWKEARDYATHSILITKI